MSGCAWCAVRRRASRSPASRSSRSSVRRRRRSSRFGALGVRAFAGVGALVALRRPGNPVGWLLLGDRALSRRSYAGEAYAEVRATGRAGAWLDQLVPTCCSRSAIIFLPLLFPDGRLPSPRWRSVLWWGRSGRARLLERGARTRALELESPRVRQPGRRRGRAGRGAGAVERPSAPRVLAGRGVGGRALPPRARRRAPAAQVVRARRRLGAVCLSVASWSADHRGRPLTRRRSRLARRLGSWSSGPARHRRRDPPLPPLRHRPRHLAHARLRRADRHARRGLPRARAAERARGRASRTSRSRSRRSRWPRSFRPPARASRRLSTSASTAAATTPSARSRRSAPGCATRSTSRRSAGDLRGVVARRCSPPTSRSGCGGGMRRFVVFAASP